MERLELVYKDIQISYLLQLCDSLNLPLLVISNDIGFQFKFNELRSKRAFEYLDDGKGRIDVDKFVKWWMSSVDDLKSFQ